MSTNKTCAISSWISLLISTDMLSDALRLHEFHNRASFRLLNLLAMIFQYFTGALCLGYSLDGDVGNANFKQPRDRRDCNFVNVAPLQLAEEFAHVHGKLLVNSFRLGFEKEVLKTGIIPDWIPDRIDLQTRNRNDLTGRESDQLANYFYR